MTTFITGTAAVPSDSTVLSPIPKAIYVGGAGAVAIRWLKSQSNTTFAAVPAGTVLEIRPDKILSTGTTATNLILLY